MTFEAIKPFPLMTGGIAFSIDGQAVDSEEFFSELEHAKEHCELVKHEATYSRFFMEFTQ